MIRFVSWMTAAIGWCISAYNIVPLVYATSVFDGLFTALAFAMAGLTCFNSAFGEDGLGR